LAKEALSRQPDDLAAQVLLVASLAIAENAEEAQSALARGPRIDSTRLDRLWVIDWLGLADRERIKAGLRKAGWDGASGSPRTEMT
jgi:hypothetical protein